MTAAVSLPARAALHPLEDIRATAVDFVRQQMGLPGTELNISAGPLDSRLRLPQCELPLQAYTPHAIKPVRNTTISVRCNGKKNWSIYVPVKIQVYQELAVAGRSLPANAILTQADIQLVKMDVSRYAGSYMTDPALLDGLQLTRPVQYGQPITQNMLKAPVTVRTGDKVRLVSRSTDFEVNMEGVALMNGAVGDTIRVRNLRSKRIIEGKLQEHAVVLVN